MTRFQKRRRAPSHPQFAGNADSDRGATGVAMLARPCSVEQIATGSIAIGRERSEALRYKDAHLVDRLHRAAQISDRQHEAAVNLLEMWTAAGVEPAMVASYGEKCSASQDNDDAVNEPTAADHYRRLMRPFRGAGPVNVAQICILESVLMGRHPGVRFLAPLQAALDDLADFWRMGVR